MEEKKLNEISENVEKKQPKAKFKAGAFRVTCWENQTKDNPEKTYNSLTLERVYKVGDDWKTERINMFDNDIQKVVVILTEMFKEINMKEE